MAGGQLDQADRAWQDASDAESVARSEALASAGRRIEQGDLETFGRQDTIRAGLEPIEARIWPLIRKQPDESWADKSKRARYFDVCFRVRGELLPEQAVMAYGAEDLLRVVAGLGRAGERAGRAEIDAAQRALAELWHGLLGELRAGNLVASCAPDPAAGQAGGTLAAGQAARLEWRDDRLCLPAPHGTLMALRDPRVKPAQDPAPAPPEKPAGETPGERRERESLEYLLDALAKGREQPRAMWKAEIKPKFPGLSDPAFDHNWRMAAKQFPYLSRPGAPRKSRG